MPRSVRNPFRNAQEAPYDTFPHRLVRTGGRSACSAQTRIAIDRPDGQSDYHYHMRIGNLS